MDITAELVKTLRDKTNCGFMDCKKALQETAGDLEAAVTYLRQKGIAVATKRAERATSEGAVFALLDQAGATGVVLEINCESDFVAKTEAFQAFGQALAAQIAGDAAPDVDALLSRPWQAKPSITVQDYLNEIIGQLGENIRLHRFARFAGGGPVGAYIHFGGKIGVLVQLSGGRRTPELSAVAKDLAMHVAASNPLAVARDNVDLEVVAKEQAIYAAQARESGKPEKIIEKMVTGRLEKFFKEVCLLEQPFVKNPDLTVAQVLKEVDPQLTVTRFARYQVGT